METKPISELESISLSEDELLLVDGGNTPVKCGYGCGMGCGNECGGNCSGNCGTDDPGDKK